MATKSASFCFFLLSNGQLSIHYFYSPPFRVMTGQMPSLVSARIRIVHYMQQCFIYAPSLLLFISPSPPNHSEFAAKLVPLDTCQAYPIRRGRCARVGMPTRYEQRGRQSERVGWAGSLFFSYRIFLFVLGRGHLIGKDEF